MRNLTITTMVLIAVLFAAPGAAEEGWISMFDGKTLNGWKATELPENWAVEDGVLTGKGPHGL